MTDLEKQADIADKKLFYEEAKQRAIDAATRATQAETAARVAREHANKMAERANVRLMELRDVLG
jgi:hypothetical protein